MARKTQLSFTHQLSFSSGRPKKSGRWVFAFLMLPVLGGVMAYGLNSEMPPVVRQLAAPTMQAAPQSPETVAKAEAPTPPEPKGERIDFIVRRDDTLERIFRHLKLSVADLTAIAAVPTARDNLAYIKPDHQITVVHVDGAVKSLSHRINDSATLTVTRKGGGFVAQVEKTPTEVKPVPASGTIDASLLTAARMAGVTPETMLQLANDVFGWEIDFALDVRQGDRFHVIYESKFQDGEYVGDGRILAAEFVNEGETHRAVYYASADGKVGGYFTPDGRSLRRQFLRTPLDLTRASLAFNPSRPQPVLHTIHDHAGVDYVAPVGTIVKAAGDGRIGYVGDNAQYGKVVTIEHGNGISTFYGHLAAFEKTLQRGQPIKQGDTIGYVGRSGAATGPHLHYEYRVNGVHTDPRTVKVREAASIPAAYEADFHAKAKVLLGDFERTPQTVATAPDSNANN